MAAETLKRGAEYAGARGIILGVEDDGGITDFAKETIEIVTRARIDLGGNESRHRQLPAARRSTSRSRCRFRTRSARTSRRRCLDDGKTRAPFDGIGCSDVRAARLPGYMGLEYEAEENPTTAVPNYLKQLKELAQNVA